MTTAFRSLFCHPELVSGSRFLVLRIWVLKPRPVGGVLYYFLLDQLPRQMEENRKKKLDIHLKKFGSLKLIVIKYEYGKKS